MKVTIQIKVEELQAFKAMMELLPEKVIVKYKIKDLGDFFYAIDLEIPKNKPELLFGLGKCLGSLMGAHLLGHNLDSLVGLIRKEVNHEA